MARITKTDAEWTALEGQALMLATRARALLQGRLSPSIDDVVALAHPVLRHRIALTYSARAESAPVRWRKKQLL